MSTLVKKIIFRDNDLLNRLYLGNELIFYTEQEHFELDYLTFTANSPSTIRYKPSRTATAKYSFDKVNWKYADYITLNLNTGDKVYFKGNITGSQAMLNYAQFTMTGKISASGSIMSMQNGNPDDKTIKYNSEFYGLFEQCESLITAPELPAVKLTRSCYYGLFDSCKNLKKAPYLPAITLYDYSYKNIFCDCTNLNYVKCEVMKYNDSNFIDWLKNVAPTGDFYCHNPSIFPTGGSGIPDGWRIHKLEPKEYDVVYVSGRYEFKIPKSDGTYYVLNQFNDCMVDVITDKDFTSLNQTIIASNSVGDEYEWELFFNGSNLYFDIGYKFGERLSYEFGTLKKDTLYTIVGSNGNYLGEEQALYVNGSKKVSSTTKSTYNNTSDIIKIGENVTNVYISNIKIYDNTRLVHNIVPIMCNGIVEFYDNVKKRFIDIISTPPSEYVKTRLTGKKISI